jgi:hypothetical protein
MSALPLKADIRRASRYVRFVPEADINLFNRSHFGSQGEVRGPRWVDLDDGVASE